MGESPFAKNLRLSFEAGFRGRHRKKALLSGTHGIPSGGGGCVAHAPPRCRGETESRNKCQSVGTAFLKASCDEMRDVAKSMSKEY